MRSLKPLARTGEFDFAPTGRVDGEFAVSVKGRIVFVGRFDAAMAIFLDHSERNDGHRHEHDAALRRALLRR